MSTRTHWGVAVVVAALAAGCGSDDGGTAGPPGGSGGSSSGGNGGGINFDGGAASGGSEGGTRKFPIGPDGYPIGFTKTDHGARKLGEPFDGTPPGDANCGSVLLGVVRDFKDGSQPGGHPDFETFTGDGLQGIVKDTLGADGKPVYAASGSTVFTTGKAEFDQWYRNTDGVNQPFIIYFFLVPNAGVYTFESNAFFPLDGAGFGNQGNPHNFHFTTEVHTKFKYNGGETFRFQGDDDLWVFINDKLAIDLGGLHPKQQQQIDLDTAASGLGISPGNIYSLALFHAERHTDESNFRIDTNLQFVDCGTTVPEPR